MQRLILENGLSQVEIIPGLGGGIAAFDAITSRGPKPVLRRMEAGKSAPFDLASNVLVPFSNRISGGGFEYGGVYHKLAPNLEGEPFPIHGDGFQKAWDVEAIETDQIVLVLNDGHFGPFQYSARIGYKLDGRKLTNWLEITNTGPELPFGGGFHPWLPRFQDTTLQFSADRVWTEDERHLPQEELDLGEATDWNYQSARALPDDLINNAFTGYSGVALVRQPALGIDVTIVATPPLSTAIVYSPNKCANFFCFEPVSHAVDAHNQQNLPGLVPLQTGESLRLVMDLSWSSRD